jgi:hypothetical protein
MRGDSHCFVANLALANLIENERHILYPRWGGIEAGATLSDHFRIMWESIEPGSKNRQLVHRCFIDSKNSKDHGCITRALDHTVGSISFIKDFMKGELNEAYTEDEFLENLGMFLGIASHHVTDICTPVHVGYIIDVRSLGYRSLNQFHIQLERDILRLQNQAKINLQKPKLVKFTQEYFWRIASDIYERYFTRLKDIYTQNGQDGVLNMVSGVLSAAVNHTADVWHTVLKTSKMTQRQWSMQPLL